MEGLVFKELDQFSNRFTTWRKCITQFCPNLYDLGIQNRAGILFNLTFEFRFMALGAGWNARIFGKFHFLSAFKATQGAGRTDFTGAVKGIWSAFLKGVKVEPVAVRRV
jgi:hypothetical protein